ncbi:small GTP-binding protein [Histomonas meleagridis]|uniref:small GTP-binding protein n=1 Tax=Histomonas meleagridis TaxID=135588 RepID=UPI003559D28B|nr:small GTP-binding protein [Histomonas meleagridis]KAH0806442.1 small GTP-binding protein [Histomonas meleagridis]
MSDPKQENKSKTELKVVFLGSAGVGKTSIINSFMYGQFTNQYEITIGVDYFTKPIKVGEETVNLQIWDTAGQEKFHSLIPTYIRDTSIAVLVYDVSKPQSFESAKEWYEKVLEYRGNEAKCVLAGNKIDLEIKVEESSIHSFTESTQMEHIQVSAKTGDHIHELFEKIAKESKSIVPQDKGEVVTVNAKQVQNDGQKICC